MEIELKSEERRLTSIPGAIGLFMIFKALFYRGALSSLQGTDGWSTYLRTADAAGFWLFLSCGLALCFSKRLIWYWLSYIACVATLFGTIYPLAAEPGFSARLLLEGSAHIILVVILARIHRMILRISKRGKTEA